MSEHASVTGRVLAVDLGSRRIGVAVSDSRGALAFPHCVVERGSSRSADHDALREIAASLGASTVVVGLPRSLNGRIGPAAEAVLEEARELSAALGFDVVLVDERMTTVVAEKAMRSAGRAGSARRVRKARVDAAAAAVILQAWLDRQSPSADIRSASADRQSPSADTAPPAVDAGAR